jgi:hypothetical protein
MNDDPTSKISNLNAVNLTLFDVSTLTIIIEVTLPNFRTNLTTLNSSLAVINNALLLSPISPFTISPIAIDANLTRRQNASAIHFNLRLKPVLASLDLLLARNGILDRIGDVTSSLRQSLLNLKQVTNETIVSLFYVR